MSNHMGKALPIGSEDIQKFLVEVHRGLLDGRRNYEWKVLFGFLSLLVVFSWAVVGGELEVNHYLFRAYSSIVVSLTVITLRYLWHIQRRNNGDRQVINHIIENLCGVAGVPEQLIYWNKGKQRKSRVAVSYACLPQFLFVLLVSFAAIAILYQEAATLPD